MYFLRRLFTFLSSGVLAVASTVLGRMELTRVRDAGLKDFICGTILLMVSATSSGSELWSHKSFVPMCRIITAKLRSISFPVSRRFRMRTVVAPGKACTTVSSMGGGNVE